MKKINLLLALALITLTAIVSGCGKDDQDGAVVNTPGYGSYNGYQYPPQNCVNGVCTCTTGMTYQTVGNNGYCYSNTGWNGFNQYNNPCYAYYGPYAQPTYTSYGQLVCVINQNSYQSNWYNKCQGQNFGTMYYYYCSP